MKRVILQLLVFLDLDDLPVYQNVVKYRFSGYDVRRRLYKASNGLKYNADVNGSLNILRKAVPNAFSNGIMGVVVHQLKLGQGIFFYRFSNYNYN